MHRVTEFVACFLTHFGFKPGANSLAGLSDAFSSLNHQLAGSTFWQETKTPAIFALEEVILVDQISTDDTSSLGVAAAIVAGAT